MTTELAVAEGIYEVAVGSIVRCRYQPRSFAEEADEGLRELASNIGKQGVIEPLVVRPLDEVCGSSERSDGINWDAEYELVCGERRWRAALLAGLETVPCVVRELDDKHAAMVCLSENRLREDLRPLEEARGIQTLIKEGWEREEIASELGVSLERVCRRAKLLDLSETWRSLVDMPGSGVDEWGAGKLELVARYPVEVQERLATEFDDFPDYGRGISYMGLRDLFAREMRVLGDAPWALDEIVVEGAGTCEACTKRSDAQRELFGEDELTLIKSNGRKSVGPRCLDGACFYSKMGTYVRRQFATLGSKHWDLILVKGDSEESFISKEQLDGDMAFENEHLVEGCKKKDEGARKCLRVGGSKAGSSFWGRLKIDRGTADGTDKRGLEPEPPTDSATEVTEATEGGATRESGGPGGEPAEFLHWKGEAGKVLELLDAGKETPALLLTMPHLITGINVFYCGQAPPDKPEHETWSVFEDALIEHVDGQMKKLERTLLDLFAERLRWAIGLGNSDLMFGEVDHVCGVCGFDYLAYAEAEEVTAVCGVCGFDYLAYAEAEEVTAE